MNSNLNRPTLQSPAYGAHPNANLMASPGMMANPSMNQPPTSMHIQNMQTHDLNQTGPQMSNSVPMNTGLVQSTPHMNMGTPNSVQPMVGMNMPVALQPGMPQHQPPHQLPNATLLCRLGQETVQDIVQKTTELFQYLKVMLPPNGTQPSITSQEEKKVKVQETLKTITTLFKRLRKLYEKCNETCSGMEYIQIESLIPLREDSELGSNKQSQDDKKFSDSIKHLNEEHRGYVEQLRLRNRHIKELIDNLRSIVWEINTMLAMRKP